MIAAVGLWWAKWHPYELKARTMADTREWSGKAIFGKAGDPGATPTLDGMWTFTQAYIKAVWKAAVVAILMAAALEAFVPRRWLLKVLSRRSSMGQGVAGGLLSMPSMMCTCCTAPVAVGLRRRGAPAGASVAYWLGNPLLNPAVFVFLALTLPWQFVTTRAVIGVVVVVGAALIANRVAGGATADIAEDIDEDPRGLGDMAVRYLKALVRFALILIPEYFLLVLLVGLFSGWLSNFAHLGDSAGPLSLLIVGLIGAALVIPTAGEIPVMVGLIAAGASYGVAGVLLITLPALSIPSIGMVARSFGAKTVAAVTAWVVVGGLGSAALLTALV